MQIRGNGVAIALGALAVAIAATGTAYAITATQVQIVDGTRPANVVHVDNNGHLSMAGATSNIQVFAYVYSAAISGTAPLTTPTTAGLAVTAVNYNNSRNLGQANLDYAPSLAKITVGSGGTCFDSDATIQYYREDSMRAGASVNVTFASPLQFRSTGGKKYCLGVRVIEDENVIGVTQYPVGVTLDAYATTGTYTGTGAVDAPAPQVPGPRRAAG